LNVAFDTPTALTVTNRHRRETSQALARALYAVSLQYAESWQRIEDEIDRVLLVYPDDPSRLLVTRELLDRELIAIAERLAVLIPTLQRDFVERALRHSRESLSLSLPSVVTAPPAAFAPFVGTNQAGARVPARLSDLSAKLSVKFGAVVATAVAVGIGAAHSPKRIARAIRSGIEARRESTDAPLVVRAFYAETHAASLHAYRETMRETIRQNGIREWRWLSSRNRRTCLACWAMDGQTFPTSTPMTPHPNCRCSIVAVTPLADQLFGQTGEEIFDRLPDDEKRAVMGAAKFRAYQAGTVTLRDFVGIADSPITGPAYVERSLKSILGDRAREFYRP
jgi:hypothetical protein